MNYNLRFSSLKVYLFFLLLFSTFYPTQIFCQHVLKGKVLRKDAYSPLTGANILVKGTNKGSIADVNGHYYISLPDSGTYTFVYSFVGYQSQSKTIHIKDLVEENVILSLDTLNSESVVVYGKRIYPITQTTISKTDLKKQNFGQDLPFLLNQTPSIVVTSDAGAGIGYTGVRIRGSDAQRTNVTINGIPLNDSESQGVFWVNLPDFASSVDNITIQRGVGTSVNGAGAFGASVNVNTSAENLVPTVESNFSIGSFNTLKGNVIFNTGNLSDKFSLNGRLSRIYSDGYIDNAFTDLGAYYLSARYESKIGTFTANAFSGEEQTFQAWNGVLQDSVEAGNRTYNELAGYDNETDNYQQDHYQLLYNKALNQNWLLHIAGHYTRGRGFFEQFRTNDDLANYNINPVDVGDTLINSSDLIRRLWLDNHFFGGLFSLDYQSDKTIDGVALTDLTFGGSANRYLGKHFGEVIWSRFAGTSAIRNRFGENDATKNDFSLYAKLNQHIFGNVWGLLDLQGRHVSYNFLGFDRSGANVDQNVALFFFNPKAGLKIYFPQSQLYLFYAFANHEPNRSDYTESSPDSRPKPEKLHNVEIGYTGLTGAWRYSVNYYLMYYIDQLVSVGNVNDVGEYTRTNVDNSYRTGLELQSEWKIVDPLIWTANLTLSLNKIPDYTERIDDFDNGGIVQRQHTQTDIAFSPAVIAGSQINFLPAENFEITLLSKYVGRQFLDNTSDENRSIDPYFVNDLRLIYTITPKKLFKNLRFSLLINNIFNNLYETNGYTFGFIAGGEQRFNYLYPQASTNFLFSANLRF